GAEVPLMSRPLRAALAALAAAPLVLALAPAAGADQGDPPSRQQAYADAAREFGVPQSVLLGVSYLESRWDDHAGRPSRAGGYGPMHLTDVRAAEGAGGRGDGTRTARVSDPSLHTVDLAAKLTGVDPAELR